MSPTPTFLKWGVLASGVLVASLALNPARALTLDDIQLWAGTGTNRAAMVIHWTTPEVRNETSVPNPIAERSLAWGYRWNGRANAEDLFNALLATDPRLFAVVSHQSAYGKAVFALGYDLNNNRNFGVRRDTNILASVSFTNGLLVRSFSDADAFQSLDPGDLYWSGWYGPSWELWHEPANNGGFTNNPNLGPNPYWTPDDPDQPWTGAQGQWEYAQFGMSGLELTNGSWIGWSVAAGGFDFLNPDAPGTVAYNFHKHAPVTPVAAESPEPFVTQVVSGHGPFGPSPYNDTNSLVGAPTTWFYDPFGSFSGGTTNRRVKLVEPAYNIAGNTNGLITPKLITTLGGGSEIITRFERPVQDDPAHPYGIDLLVFGNSFYTANGFVNDSANLNTLQITGGGFFEPIKVSVSPGYTGQPGEVANNPNTWPWYRYDNGPYADTAFPTHAYKWNRATTNWSDETMDFSKPVNPAMRLVIGAGGLSAADAIDLYTGSGGGTGFDLHESGFAWIQYVKVEGIDPEFSDGEVDAFATVRPMTIGDSLSITPENILSNTATLKFQKPGAENENVVTLAFTEVSNIALVFTTPLSDLSSFATLPGVALTAVQLALTPILAPPPALFTASLALTTGANYTGNGSDLLVAQSNGTNWNLRPFSYNAVNHQVSVAGVTNLSAFVVVQFSAPTLQLDLAGGNCNVSFTPVAGLLHALERSTNLANWMTLGSFTASNALSANITDNSAPIGKAFYRLRLEKP